MGSGNSGDSGVGVRRSARQMSGVGSQFEGLSQDANLMAMSQGKLNPYAQQMYDEQMKQIQMGSQGSYQNVREQAQARGMYSSTSALQAEAGIPMQESMARAGIYGQQSALSQQGVLQGMALRGNLLGGATNAYSGAGQSYGMSAQLEQQAQQQQQQGILGAGALIAAPFTGGMSLGGYGASQGGTQGTQNYSGVNLNKSYSQNYGGSMQLNPYASYAGGY